MTSPRPALLAAGIALGVALGLAPALAQQAAPRPAQGAKPQPAAAQEPKKDAKPAPLGGFGANSKEPIKIDADRLDVFDREGRAVFSGNVVAVQGDSIMRCTTMTVFYEAARGANRGAAPAPAAAASGGDSSIKKIDCAGPVTVTSKTQTATGDNAIFDKAANKVVLSGNAALSDGPNVTRGDRIVYDLDTGVANVEGAKPGDRVKALFVPGSQDSSQQTASGAKPADAKKPEAARPAAQQAAPRPATRAATN